MYWSVLKMNPCAKSAQSVLFQQDECNITFHVNRRAHAIMHSRCHFFKSVLGPESGVFVKVQRAAQVSYSRKLSVRSFLCWERALFAWGTVGHYLVSFLSGSIENLIVYYNLILNFHVSEANWWSSTSCTDSLMTSQSFTPAPPEIKLKAEIEKRVTTALSSFLWRWDIIKFWYTIVLCL